ncbi:DUF4097 family beta strand repeat-containing protein [Mucilaginibacter aquatilis]|uniref:Adhesin domain-containing protein n=1 Tax=Mucilaginibacter aquatilis TaxID=1517760 RepID=A0A6I4II43_9SPHI|nr:hypothetical protein [Mucilaginibacter aquatilis]MVN93136.1 hypothetical protein [Mucilaginibacter aquatilis]
MKKFTLIAFMVLGCSAAMAQNKWTTEPYLTKNLSSAGIKDVFAETSGGSISVTGVAASEARIEVYVSPNNSNDDITKEEIKQRLEDNYKLEITDANHELHVTAKSKAFNLNWRKAVSISFKIYVPKAVATNLRTSGGSINIGNLTGVQNFATSGGSLKVNNVSGKIKGRTSGGSIHIDNAKQEIDLTTSGGSIVASNCEGKISLTTSGGSLKLNNLSGDINATTSGGSIHADGISGELITSTSGGSVNLTQLACSVEGSTSGGSIHADFKSVGKYVRLSTSAGGISITMPTPKGLDLDLKGSRVNASLSNFSGTKEKDRVEGKLNGGGIPVTAHASSGSVNLSFN